MARRRFYAPPENITDSLVSLSTEETHHLIRVLRTTPGDEAFVFDGCGREYGCRFRTVQDGRALLDVLNELDDVVESPIQVELAQGLAKGEKFDFIVQKATELGVTSIAPLVTRYSDVKLDDLQTSRRVERWRRISLEAMKQCGRRKLVEIAAPRTLNEFLGAYGFTNGGDSTTPRTTFLLFSERGGVTVPAALAMTNGLRKLVALIGPEGGWSNEELEFASQSGCRPVTLGPRLLRTETAAVVAIALIEHALGDLSV
ncbi:MAG TPA: 16S rRNA (uracil(1498)-N(3))-methyltransferase [Blastocatellia bacterium]|nr:16S rRNA (uracil(1498)-N(3))-methyltransferase [Blastocatellia bacterium]